MIELLSTDEAPSKRDEDTIECFTADDTSSFWIIRDEKFTQLKVRFLHLLTENHLNLLKNKKVSYWNNVFIFDWDCSVHTFPQEV